jgi:hypothetical protein
MRVEDRASVGEESIARLAAELAPLGSLEDVVSWGLAQRPRLVVSEVVVQDELTHDVVLPYRDGLYLVFDTT